MKSSIITFITAIIGTARNIPIIPKYAPPTVTASITNNGLICNEFPTIFGFIMFASICCNIVTITSIHIACDTPPVSRVIIPAITTAIIAPMYGIKLNSPIIKPSNTAYFTPSMLIAIDVNIPTTIASINWLDKKWKNISFVW